MEEVTMIGHVSTTMYILLTVSISIFTRYNCKRYGIPYVRVNPVWFLYSPV